MASVYLLSTTSPRLVQFLNSTIPWEHKIRTIRGPPVVLLYVELGVLLSYYIYEPIQDFLKTFCNKVVWSQQFIGHLRTLSLKFQKATTEIGVFLTLPS